VFEPERIHLPLPALIRLMTALVPSVITPAKLLAPVLLPPSVRVLLPVALTSRSVLMVMVLPTVALLFSIVPPPASVPLSSIRRLLKSRGEAVPAPNLKMDEFALPFNWIGFTPSARLLTVSPPPALPDIVIRTLPVNVFASLENVRSEPAPPAPVLKSSVPLPESGPVKVIL